MIRAGVFIGVDRTGGLDPLRGAASGARAMHAWALSQGMEDATQAHLITDEGGGAVAAGQIIDAIEAIIDGSGVDQLIVYFAGHGMNINRSEVWLLTDAPRRTDAAINLAGSVELARYSGIGHVVFISDTCRTPADSITAQRVSGVDIFPNDGVGHRAHPVDQFFACALGRPAVEILYSPGAFSGVYTDVLLEALGGSVAAVMEPDGDDPAHHYLRPPRLRAHLEREIPERIRRHNLVGTVSQSPDAIVVDGGRWLARCAIVGSGTISAPPSEAGVDPLPAPPPSADDVADLWDRPDARQLWRAVPPPIGGDPPSLRERVDSLVAAALTGGSPALAVGLEGLSAPDADAATAAFLATVNLLATARRSPAGGRAASIQTRGAAIVEARCPGGEVALADGVVSVALRDRPSPVLLAFDSGLCAVMPASPGAGLVLTFEDGELIDVCGGWADDGRSPGPSGDLTRRAVVVAAAEHGLWRPDRDGVDRLTRWAVGAEGGATAPTGGGVVDLGLALEALWAAHDMQWAQMVDVLANAIATGLPEGFPQIVGPAQVDVIPNGPAVGQVVGLPLMARGWALPTAWDRGISPQVAPIRSALHPSSRWSIYDVRVIERLWTVVRGEEGR